MKDPDHTLKFGEVRPAFWYYQACVQQLSIQFAYVFQGVSLPKPPLFHRLSVFLPLFLLQTDPFFFDIPVETDERHRSPEGDILRSLPWDAQAVANCIHIFHCVGVSRGSQLSPDREVAKWQGHVFHKFLASIVALPLAFEPEPTTFLQHSTVLLNPPFPLLPKYVVFAYVLALQSKEYKIIHPSENWADSCCSKDVQKGVTKESKESSRGLLPETRACVESERLGVRGAVFFEADHNAWPLVFGERNDSVCFGNVPACAKGTRR